MRQSKAGLARIQRVGSGGQVEYLVQWSDRWKMFSLVGGHVEPDESFRDCCIREICEELELTNDDFCVGESLRGPIEYTAFSHGSGILTRYRVELFPVELASIAIQQKVTAVPTNRWLNVQEIVTMVTQDGQPVSEQVRIVLDLE